MNISSHVWPCFRYADAPAAIEFLTSAFGFTVAADYRDTSDPEVIVHAELRWPHGGGVMLGSVRDDASPFGSRTPGNGCTYLVAEDVDALHARAVAAGATIVAALSDQSYGSRDFTACDPEGNLWAFGTYAGAEEATPPAPPQSQ